MTPQEFIAKWGPGGPAYDLNERQGAQPTCFETFPFPADTAHQRTEALANGSMIPAVNSEKIRL